MAGRFCSKTSSSAAPITSRLPASTRARSAVQMRPSPSVARTIWRTAASGRPTMWRISDSSVARSPARSAAAALAAGLQLLVEQRLDALQRHRLQREAAGIGRQFVGQRDVVAGEHQLQATRLGAQRQLLQRARDHRVRQVGMDVEQQHQRVALQLLHRGQRGRQLARAGGIAAGRARCPCRPAPAAGCARPAARGWPTRTRPRACRAAPAAQTAP